MTIKLLGMTRETAPGEFSGTVICFDGPTRLWSRPTAIRRLTRNDAWQDVAALKRDIAAENNRVMRRREGVSSGIDDLVEIND